MTEAEIKAFLTVVNLGSVTLAAKELYLTQPAVSRFYVYDLQEAPNPITLFALYHKEKMHHYGEIILALWKKNAAALQDEEQKQT